MSGEGLKPDYYKTDRREARQRANKARKNAKTCPASRHVHMIVNELTDPKGAMYQLLENAGYEPAHMGSSIASVLACLWEARQFMEWERLPPTKRYPLANGRWVPIKNTRAKETHDAD